MRKVFITGVGSLVLVGLLVTQSWAGTFKSDLTCAIPFKQGAVTITAHGNVKGSVKLLQPLAAPLSLDCKIFCANSVAAGPSPCVEADTGDTKLKINAPGLGAAAGVCPVPAVLVGDICISAYFPAP